MNKKEDQPLWVVIASGIVVFGIIMLFLAAVTWAILKIFKVI